MIFLYVINEDCFFIFIFRYYFIVSFFIKGFIVKIGEGFIDYEVYCDFVFCFFIFGVGVVFIFVFFVSGDFIIFCDGSIE